eukprot:CAMPEP_0201903902 /NCGR_PEP_ID=MMETSP0902-20130614/55722_1 /ASSEMBLY_ACC=CAM_ASM_000551 /TAXON_ID=420261 /ORGANISM="Thalassiosira antarctica, Strain CCMP982" /LENGTH=379 /DNA_ID=CAMNT_0048437971 /DNA_START=461 /DNA_END=1597 /DNA_ORIENTATION=+
MMMTCTNRPARIHCHTIIPLLGMLHWFQFIHHFNVANAFYPSQIQHTIARHHTSPSSPHHRLYGISEWRAKFSPPPSNSSQTITDPTDSLDLDSTPTTLPLLLLPFTPTQILLPGQSTTLQFRHGKYMDIIDESITSYESVVGMSILDEDGLLPHVVVCEVLEEELEVNMGYRGFSSMEVGVRAVGRARRIMSEEEEEPRRSSSSPGNDTISFRGRTALDDIHLGEFVEWQDDALNGDEFELASEYLGNIKGLLMLAQQSDGTSSSNPPPELDDGIQRQQILFTKAMEQFSANPAALTFSADSNSQQHRQQHAQLVASSWATFAATEGSDARSSSIITRALATKDTVERLHLGLAMMLESHMPNQQDAVGEVKKFGYSG